jgi:hypothetical protein
MGKKLANLGVFVGGKLLKSGVETAAPWDLISKQKYMEAIFGKSEPYITDTGNNHDVQNEPIKSIGMPRKSRN